jgi:DNA-binding MarR family transcriptional regulator
MTETTEPRWLTESEHETWMVLVGLMHKLPGALDSQLRRDAELTHFEYAVLATLSAAKNRTLSMTDIATFASCSLSRLSHVVSRMEARNWVKRSPSPNNGRVTLVKLTTPGIKKLAASAPGHVCEARRLVFDALGEDQLASLRSIGTAVLERIDAIDAIDEGSTIPC